MTFVTGLLGGAARELGMKCDFWRWCMGLREQGMPHNTTVTREELYALVWTSPMIRLGERLGVSGNGLTTPQLHSLVLTAAFTVF